MIIEKPICLPRGPGYFYKVTPRQVASIPGQGQVGGASQFFLRPGLLRIIHGCSYYLPF